MMRRPPAGNAGEAAPDVDFAASKRQTIESFLAFAEGREMPAWPLELFLEISNVCNLQCAMCSTFSALNPDRYIELKSEDRGFIDVGNIQSSLETLLQHALNVHCFGYGEPTIHPEFRAFLNVIARYRVMIDFFTNGMHLTPDLCAFLVDKRVERVTVSFSGVTKVEYENVYLGGHFETVLQGIEALAAEKERQRSPYPLIEINSLSFEHHVQKLDRFVDFMADRGANVIHLKRLQTQFNIPQLKGHESMLRPWVEGDVLDKARRRAEARGISFSAAQFQMTEVASEEDWQRGKTQQGLSGASASDQRAVVPIEDFRRLSKEAKPTRSTERLSIDQNSLYHDVAPERLSEYLGIKPPAHSAEPFYCMEPFKTVYVRRNGLIKPCCFANDRAPALGTTLQQDGRTIWRGEHFNAVRVGILNQQYPEPACGYCLKNKIGPRKHQTHARIDAYLKWYRQTAGRDLMPSPVARLRSLGGNTMVAQRVLAENPALRMATAVSGPRADEQCPIRHPRAVQRLAERVAALHRQGRTLEGVVEGHLDSIIDGHLSGWVWSPLFPRKRFEVAVYDFDTEIGRVLANRFRNDLLQAEKGEGRCAFGFDIPRDLYDGRVHGFRARLLGTDFYLRSAPVILSLPSQPPERMLVEPRRSQARRLIRVRRNRRNQG